MGIHQSLTTGGFLSDIRVGNILCHIWNTWKHRYNALWTVSKKTLEKCHCVECNVCMVAHLLEVLNRHYNFQSKCNPWVHRQIRCQYLHYPRGGSFGTSCKQSSKHNGTWFLPNIIITNGLADMHGCVNKVKYYFLQYLTASSIPGLVVGYFYQKS